MEYELTELSEINLKTEKLAVTKEANVYEATTAKAKASNKMGIYIREEQKTQAY